MNGELLYAHSRWRFRVYWTVFYFILIGLCVAGGLLLAGRIRTSNVPVGEVQLSIPYSTYVVGEAITFTLKNGFNAPIYITNDCPNEPLNVYKWQVNSWKRLHDTAPPQTCTGEARQVRVPAGGSISGTFAPWRNLFSTPGKYRVVAEVEYYNALPYQDITIIAKPRLPNSSSPTTETTPIQPSSGQTPSSIPSTTREDDGQGGDN